MPRLKAAQMLERARNGDVSLTAEGWHDLTLIVTGNKEEAERAMRNFIKSSRAAGVEPQ